MIDDPNFSLELGSSWQSQPGDDPGQYQFRDDARDIVIALSAKPLDIAPDRLDETASMFVEVRLAAERDAGNAVDRRMTIYEPIVVPQVWGRAVAYYGHDDTGRQFSFSGMVTCRCAIGLYMSSGRLSERELMEAMDEVGSQITFDRSPLQPDAPLG